MARLHRQPRRHLRWIRLHDKWNISLYVMDMSSRSSRSSHEHRARAVNNQFLDWSRFQVDKVMPRLHFFIIIFKMRQPGTSYETRAISLEGCGKWGQYQSGRRKTTCEWQLDDGFYMAWFELQSQHPSLCPASQ